MTTPCLDAPTAGPLGRTFGGLPGQFWFQWVGVLVNRLGMFVQPFLILYLTDARGLPAAQAGVLVAVWGAGSLVGPLLGGWLADRIGRRETMAGAMLAAAVALGALGAARSVPAMAVAALFAGITADLYRPANSALVADLVRPEDRARAFGLLFWAVNIGFAIAATAGGYLAGAGYGLLFAVDAATCAAFAGLIWFGIRRDTRPAVARRAGPPVGYRSALRDRILVALLGLTLLYATLYDQAYITLPLAIRDAGLPTSTYGAVIAVNGIVIVALQPFASAWLSRFQPAAVLAVSGLVVGLGFGATGLADGPVAFGATVALWTLGEIGMAGLIPALAAELAPPEARGRYQGLFTLSWGASALVAPVVGTAVYAGLAPAVLWTGCLTAGILLAVGHLVLGQAVRRRTALASAA
jgi:MFS family permease